APSSVTVREGGSPIVRADISRQPTRVRRLLPEAGRSCSSSDAACAWSARLPRSGFLLGPAPARRFPPGVLCFAATSRVAATAVRLLSTRVSPAGYGASRLPAGGPPRLACALRGGPARGRAAR